MKNEELKFEWDENKNRINIQKHGVSFEEATILFETSDLILEAKNVDEEKRFALIGKYNSKCYVCIFTYRCDKIRIISVRRCRKKEEAYYESSRI